MRMIHKATVAMATVLLTSGGAAGGLAHATGHQQAPPGGCPAGSPTAATVANTPLSCLFPDVALPNDVGNLTFQDVCINLADQVDAAALLQAVCT
ncbi:hypothetical protein, partial [Streptomyces violascens]|uniref:hypothetical protein n=1 Tax=Streptomyces violascens TaxID=67381 RepID=UPI00367E23D2